MVDRFKPFDLVINILILSLVWFVIYAILGQNMLSEAYPHIVIGVMMGWFSRSIER